MVWFPPIWKTWFKIYIEFALKQIVCWWFPNVYVSGSLIWINSLKFLQTMNLSFILMSVVLASHLPYGTCQSIKLETNNDVNQEGKVYVNINQLTSLLKQLLETSVERRSSWGAAGMRGNLLKYRNKLRGKSSNFRLHSLLQND